MSASLVGSEMCIRDSPKHLSTIGPFRSGSASPGCGVTQLSASTRKAAAVSYTHLTLPTICSV
eukprot:11597204-Alexandrium_andersonii.AAC.1